MSKTMNKSETAIFKRKQVKKKKTVDETKDSEWLPIPEVTIETDDPFKMNCKYFII